MRHKSGSFLHHHSEVTGSKASNNPTPHSDNVQASCRENAVILKAYQNLSYYQLKVPLGCPAEKPLSPVFHNCHPLSWGYEADLFFPS